MPELPEVETIKRELEKTIVGKTVADVCVYNPKVIREPSVERFKKELAGVTITDVFRKAKVLVLPLSSGKFLIVHLRMTGQLIYPADREKARVTFVFTDGTALDFKDQRLFGELRVVKDWQAMGFIKGLGPEPYDVPVSNFKKMLAGKKTRIKPLLMDQTFVSGIGNLYAAEALFRARIHPNRAASDLTTKEVASLYTAIIATLDEAIRHKGSSVDNYVQLSGEPGNFVGHHKVYDREGKPCFVCKSPVQRIALGGRGTYFCPRCQK